MSRARDFVPLRTLKYAFIYALKKSLNIPLKHMMGYHLNMLLKYALKQKYFDYIKYQKNIFIDNIISLCCKQYIYINLRCIQI